jgi:4-hydroxybutyryl-CoA dehydratase / vinylacetyl-CoA-Delta-isomerase
MDEGDTDAGNAVDAGQETLIAFDDAFITQDRVFMDGECDFTAVQVERFTGWRRIWHAA